MAKKTVVYVEDDLDGGPAEHQVTFSLDGVAYEIDLNDSNAAKLREAFAPYVNAGRRTGGRQRRQQSVNATQNRTDRLHDIRDWARANGYQIADRGRVPKTISDAYAAAHS